MSQNNSASRIARRVSVPRQELIRPNDELLQRRTYHRDTRKLQHYCQLPAVSQAPDRFSRHWPYDK